ncbi:uncharacterized protein LOC115021560 [Cottoperca gobio]|uniref:Uncharacterized protein LOC115021560 n=1 Tax=Cottoperca gobio TaxID=56716 RepID=A0A6J2RF17_COTGO|nr:uncharacterized protein LOC115021560 [Cottoperca gobio]
MVVTAPIRERRENVLSFLNDTLGTTTENAISANTTAYRNPPSTTVKEQDSEAANSLTDMSEAQSTESSNSNGFTGSEVSDKSGGESRVLDSDEIMIPKVVEKDKAPPRRKTNVGPMDMSSNLVQGSRDSEEGETVDAQETENLSGKQVICLSGDQVTGNLQRRATPGRVHRLSDMLVAGPSRDLLDRDSLEYNNGRPALVGSRGDTDYDETREFISSETYPIAPAEHNPSVIFVPAKSRAS